ncbi:hypothetical protein EW146_g7685 [Bondarzewia mesenterica]|uniref:Uncharacterized protein n=1 Tax=Bondarzewia mesenterica TaxID=1095465 RepID=A0A4S4LK36_9AGAM|nr:hypothetical protein EW146_g7685 [Bondarzewia mesenterica]
MSTTNRPRDSLLEMFDPLARPSTPPRRDVHSPDSGSDKENSEPAPNTSVGDSPLTLTKFFSRTYTKYKVLLPKMPEGGLIDFGDDTDLDSLDGEADDAGQTADDENEGDCASPLQVGCHATPQRRPLADIELEEEEQEQETPAKKTASPFNNQDTSSSAFATEKPTAAPSSSPLASVINAINGTTSSPTPSSPSFSSLSTPTLHAAPPQIIVVPPEPDSLVLASPTEPESPSPSRPPARPATSTSRLDPRRTSVDLQTSFSMHFQCPETSFDLLNDKISFLGQDSMDDLDIEAEEREMYALAENLRNATLIESAGNQIQVQAKSRHQAKQEMKAEVDADSADECDIEGSLVERLRDVKLGATSESKNESARQPPVFVTPANKREDRRRSLSNSSTERTPQAPVKQRDAFQRSPLPVNQAQVKDVPPERRISSLKPNAARKTAATAPSAPAVSKQMQVSALRIVKKAKPQEYADTIPSSTVPAPVSASSALSRITPETQPVPSARSRTTGLQRPPPGTELPKRVKPYAALHTSEDLSTRPNEIATRVRATTLTSTSTRVASAGIQRPPIEGAKDAAPTIPAGVSRLQRPASMSTGLSRRPSVASSSSNSNGSRFAAPSGLRLPSRFGAPAPSVMPRPIIGAPASTKMPASVERDPTAAMRKMRGATSRIRSVSSKAGEGPGEIKVMRRA